MNHEWKFIASCGEDAPGKSKDIFEQCTRCGAMRHDYRHNGGQTSPCFPDVHQFGEWIGRDPPCTAAVHVTVEVAGLPEVQARLSGLAKAVTNLHIMRQRVDEHGIAQVSDELLIETIRALCNGESHG